jgi:tetratricopeptide (TPR) repeat protein
MQDLAPHRGDIYFHFGSALLLVEEFDAAIKQLSQACQMLPNQVAPLFRLADAFEAVNSISDVATLIDFALKQFPEHPEVLYRAANFYRETGQLPQARELTSQCIEFSQDPLLTSYAWLLKLNLGDLTKTQVAKSPLVSILDNDDKNTKPNTQLQMIAHFALGRYFELMKKPEQAFEHWKIANEKQYSFCDHQVEDLIPLFEAIKTNTPKQMQNETESASFTPIFILGLPRTGSTLLEQMLCRHSDVTSLGEQALIANQVSNFISYHTKRSFPLFLNELTSPNGKQLRQQAAKLYESSIRKRQLNTPFVIDKLPANFQSVGLIKVIFPQAKIIHLSRNFKDTALSIFKNHFAANEPYMCDLKELSSYHSLYKQLMHHWHNSYPNTILELGYEDLVSTPRLSIEKALEYCGLKSQSSCWKSSIQKQTPDAMRIVKTLSSAQVMAPIHQRGVGRHSDYADLLKQNGLGEKNAD